MGQHCTITVTASNPKAFLRSKAGRELIRLIREAEKKKAKHDPCSLIPYPSTPEAS